RYSPQMGFEGANVIFDTFVHPLMMGLEEHLLAMFRDDFEFSDEVAPSHLGGASLNQEQEAAPDTGERPPCADDIGWSAEAERELKKVPFFVRGKARRNTELYAKDHGVKLITVET